VLLTQLQVNFPDLALHAPSHRQWNTSVDGRWVIASCAGPNPQRKTLGSFLPGVLLEASDDQDQKLR
jgi:hypothetical protein